MTHDLLRNLISQLDARVTRIVINDLKDGTGGDRMLEIDARPSDAIALALRYVAQSVLEQAQTITAENAEESEEKSKNWFENLSPEDLGKYKM
jgi:bifunctional DNase/RNase